jgi:hypothetical protein
VRVSSLHGKNQAIRVRFLWPKLDLTQFCWHWKQTAHHVMALPNVIWPWSIFYSKDQLLRKENKESLGVFYFSKLNIVNWLIVWEACAKPAKILQYMEWLESKILKTEMFEFWYVNIESWKLKFEICMWDVWNLKFWKLKCLNWDVWKLKVENWNFYVKCLEFEILKTQMSEFGCVNIESWKLKTKIWNLFVKCLEGI